MSDAPRTVASKIRRARRLVVRTELTLSALQATFWLALVAISVGAVLLLRRRLTPSAPRIADDEQISQPDPLIEPLAD